MRPRLLTPPGTFSAALRGRGWVVSVLLMVAVLASVQMAPFAKAWARTADQFASPCSTIATSNARCCCSGAIDDPADADSGSCCSATQPAEAKAKAKAQTSCCDVHATDLETGLDTCCTHDGSLAQASHGCPCISSAPANPPAIPSFPATSTQRPIVFALFRLPAILAISLAGTSTEPTVAACIEHDLSVATLEPGHDRLCSWQV